MENDRTYVAIIKIGINSTRYVPIAFDLPNSYVNNTFTATQYFSKLYPHSIVVACLDLKTYSEVLESIRKAVT